MTVLRKEEERLKIESVAVVHCWLSALPCDTVSQKFNSVFSFPSIWLGLKRFTMRDMQTFRDVFIKLKTMKVFRFHQIHFPLPLSICLHKSHNIWKLCKTYYGNSVETKLGREKNLGFCNCSSSITVMFKSSSILAFSHFPSYCKNLSRKL